MISNKTGKMDEMGRQTGFGSIKAFQCKRARQEAHKHTTLEIDTYFDQNKVGDDLSDHHTKWPNLQQQFRERGGGRDSCISLCTGQTFISAH